MVENGILKTYTFLYSENYSYTEKNYAVIIDTIEEFKVYLVSSEI